MLIPLISLKVANFCIFDNVNRICITSSIVVQFSEKSLFFSKILHVDCLTLKWMGGGGQSDRPYGFWKSVSYKQMVKLWLLVTFNFFISHILHENFIEITQGVQKIWGISLSILTNLHQFLSIFWIFWHFLFTMKLMMSAYNRWYQHFSLSTYFK